MYSKTDTKILAYAVLAVILIVMANSIGNFTWDVVNLFQSLN